MVVSESVKRVEIVRHDSGSDCGQPFSSWLVVVGGVSVGMVEACYDDANYRSTSRAGRWVVSGYAVEFYDESPWSGDSALVMARECETEVCGGQAAGVARRECFERIRFRLAQHIDAGWSPKE